MRAASSLFEARLIGVPDWGLLAESADSGCWKRFTGELFPVRRVDDNKCRCTEYCV
jgi:hypothetical protein